MGSVRREWLELLRAGFANLCKDTKDAATVTPVQTEAMKDIQQHKGLLHAIVFHIAHHGPEISDLLDAGLFDVGNVEQSNGTSYPAVDLTDAGRAALEPVQSN